MGVLSLLGKRVPISLKIFLSALAILDDLGAVLIIALFYTSGLSVSMLLASLSVIVFLVMPNRFGVTRLCPYLIAGSLLWCRASVRNWFHNEPVHRGAGLPG